MTGTLSQALHSCGVYFSPPSFGPPPPFFITPVFPPTEWASATVKLAASPPSLPSFPHPLYFSFVPYSSPFSLHLSFSAFYAFDSMPPFPFFRLHFTCVCPSRFLSFPFEREREGERGGERERDEGVEKGVDQYASRGLLSNTAADEQTSGTTLEIDSESNKPGEPAGETREGDGE